MCNVVSDGVFGMIIAWSSSARLFTGNNSWLSGMDFCLCGMEVTICVFGADTGVVSRLLCRLLIFAAVFLLGLTSDAIFASVVIGCCTVPVKVAQDKPFGDPGVGMLSCFTMDPALDLCPDVDRVSWTVSADPDLESELAHDFNRSNASSWFVDLDLLSMLFISIP